MIQRYSKKESKGQKNTLEVAKITIELTTSVVYLDMSRLAVSDGW